MCVSVCFLRVYVCWVDFWRKEGCVVFECCERWYVALFYDVMYMWHEFRVDKCVSNSRKASQGLIIFDPRNTFFAWVIDTW